MPNALYNLIYSELPDDMNNLEAVKCAARIKIAVELYYSEQIEILSAQVPKGAVDFDKIRDQVSNLLEFKQDIENALNKLK